MCKLTSKIHIGNAACLAGSGGAVVSSTPLAASAAQAKGVVLLGLGWNELGVVAGIVVGVAGLIFAQYWAHQRNKREQEMHEAQLAAMQGGADAN